MRHATQRLGAVVLVGSEESNAGLTGSCHASMQDVLGERGWALLGLILFLGVLAIGLVSIVPNVRMQVQRDKEEDMRYRGEQAARAIARYYNFGRLGPINLRTPRPYGYLTDLKKLAEGVTFGVQELRFARASELIDPMTGEEWEPVRFRDPRLGPMLMAMAAAKQIRIDAYLELAGPPPKLNLIPNQGAAGAGAQTGGQPQPGTRPGEPPVQPGRPPSPADSDDDDDDDDDPASDPLARLLGLSGSSTFGLSDQAKNNLPIVGVAPRLRGESVKPLYGVTKYEEWVFIFVPEGQVFGNQPQPQPNVEQRPNRPPGPGSEGGTRRSP